MHNLKKIILIGLLSHSCLLADEVSVTPYMGKIKYDNALSKSLKDDASFLGLDTSISDNNYVLDIAYHYININYKKSLSLGDIRQHNLSMIYTSKYSDYALKVGVHYLNSNEPESFRDLGTGYVGIAGIEGYSFFDEDRFTYGTDAYYSVYPSAHSDLTTAATLLIDVVQFTPYLEYSAVLSQSLRNDLSVKLNAVLSTQYKDPAYLSFEVSDTFVYRNFYTIVKVFGGEIKSGVLKGGLEVMNTKDLYTSSYEGQMGYYLSPTLALDISYTMNNYQEYNAGTLTLSPKGYNSIGRVSLSYSY